MSGWYILIGHILGIVVSIACFVGGWWYCTATYGFLLGFGLGWLPSSILAMIGFHATRLLWLPTLAALAVVLLKK